MSRFWKLVNDLFESGPGLLFFLFFVVMAFVRN